MGEDSRLDFTFEINLQRLCVIKIATCLWEREEIKKKFLLFFQRRYNRYEEESNLIHWNELERKVLTSLKSLALPPKINNIIQHVTKSIGLQIFNWTKYVTEVLKFEITCAQEIFWTYYGIVDKIKIFKSWAEKRILESSKLFNLACMFCLEEYIPVLWKEIPDDVKSDDFYSETIYRMSKYNLIAYFKNILVNSGWSNFISTMAVTERSRLERLRGEGHLENEEFNERRVAWLYIFSTSHSIEENMLRVSVLEGMLMGVKYFWNKLSDEQQQRNIRIATYVARCKSEEPEYAEILIFLMSKLSVEQNMNLAYEEFFVLEILLQNWPWEEFFTPVLDRFLEYYESSTDRDFENYDKKFFYLIHFFADLMNKDFVAHKNVEGTRYQILFHETWQKIPESSKILVAGKQDWLIFSKLFNVEDFKSLKMIINYEGFREKVSKRNSFISCIKSLFATALRSERKIELVEKFVNEISISEDERLKLKAEFLASVCET